MSEAWLWLIGWFDLACVIVLAFWMIGSWRGESFALAVILTTVIGLLAMAVVRSLVDNISISHSALVQHMTTLGLLTIWYTLRQRR